MDFARHMERDGEQPGSSPVFNGSRLSTTVREMRGRLDSSLKGGAFFLIQRGIGKPLSESMADEKLLRRVRKGVDALNEWRDKHREIRELDLRGADLRWAKLHKANLFGAILYKSKLTGRSSRGQISGQAS